MAVTKKEYLLMSLLAYFNFTSSEYDKCIYELLALPELNLKKDTDLESIGLDSHQNIFYYLAHELENKKFKTMRTDSFQSFLDYFSEELNKWKLCAIEDRRPTTKKILNKEIERTGFYAVSFTDGENVVISIRGSETFPIEEAYKDFIENNLVLGIGKRPKQFNNAVEFYNKHIEYLNIKKEKISLTGHSLGGGIAQFVAIYANKNFNYIPITCTWNAVGINRDGIITLNDFINFDGIIDENIDLNKESLEIIKGFKEDYFKILKECNEKEICMLENIIYENILYTALLDTYINKIYVEEWDKKELKRSIVKVLFENKELKLKIIEAKDFILKIKKNKIYEEKIKNYGHSKDLTNGLFKHVGEIHELDYEFKLKKIKENSFVKSFFSRKRHVLTYHFEDVFIPYIETEGENKGELNKLLNINFIASCLRRVIYIEKDISRELLKGYYSYKELEENEILNLRKDVIKGIEKSNLDIIYIEEVINSVKEMDNRIFIVLWKKTREKLASPYYPLDIYDSIVY